MSSGESVSARPFARAASTANTLTVYQAHLSLTEWIRTTM